jgi:hypothetical protein
MYGLTADEVYGPWGLSPMAVAEAQSGSGLRLSGGGSAGVGPLSAQAQVTVGVADNPAFWLVALVALAMTLAAWSTPD